MQTFKVIICTCFVSWCSEAQNSKTQKRYILRYMVLVLTLRYVPCIRLPPSQTEDEINVPIALGDFRDKSRQAKCECHSLNIVRNITIDIQVQHFRKFETQL